MRSLKSPADVYDWMKKGYANMQREACFCKGKLVVAAGGAGESKEEKCKD
jgi:hypothetical protein